MGVKKQGNGEIIGKKGKELEVQIENNCKYIIIDLIIIYLFAKYNYIYEFRAGRFEDD